MLIGKKTILHQGDYIAFLENPVIKNADGTTTPIIAGAGGTTFKGGYNAATNTPDLDTSPSGVLAGDMYHVTAAGNFFTVAVEIGDVLIAEIDGADAEAEWTVVQSNVIDPVLLATTDVSTASWVLDEDNLVTNDDTKVPTQQSVKAYVDTLAGGVSDNIVPLWDNGIGAFEDSSISETAGQITVDKVSVLIGDDSNNGNSTAVELDDALQQLILYTGVLTLQGSEEVSSGAISVVQASTRFDTGAGGETSTLGAANNNGVIKVLAMTTDGGGDMVTTVTNAAWGGAGTITFANVGDACTLMYINDKWVCVGNNGCIFA